MLVSLTWLIVPWPAMAATKPRSALSLWSAPTQVQQTIEKQPGQRGILSKGEPAGWGQVQWPSATVAWAWTLNGGDPGGKIVATHNGGATWTWWETPHTEWAQLVAQSPQRAWFVGGTVKGLSLIFLHTTNGGSSWTRWQLQPPPGGSTAGNDIVGVVPHAGFQAMGVFEDSQFWWTHAGGKWETAWPDTASITAVATIPGHGEAVAYKTSRGATALRSITVGSTGQVTATRLVPIPGSVIGMDWLNTREGWIWSTSHIWRTHNGGQSWTALSGLPEGEGGTLYMTSVTQGYAAVGGMDDGPSWGASALFHTDTGGRTWTRVTLPTISYPLANGQALRLGGFYVAGLHGRTLTLWYGAITADGGWPQRIWSDNGGRTWHRAQHDPIESMCLVSRT